ncbi:MAG: STAS/SEC14 domain-containing protein [Bacteroidia bacterium]
MSELEQDTFYAVFAHVRLYAEDIIHVDVEFEGELTAAMLDEHKRVVFEYLSHWLEPGKRIGILFDVRRISLLKISPGVMQDNATNDPFQHIQKGVALLVKSKILQQIAMFYIRIYRPSVATRIFTDEDNARIWLKSLN